MLTQNAFVIAQDNVLEICNYLSRSDILNFLQCSNYLWNIAEKAFTSLFIKITKLTPVINGQKIPWQQLYRAKLSRSPELMATINTHDDTVGVVMLAIMNSDISSIKIKFCPIVRMKQFILFAELMKIPELRNSVDFELLKLLCVPDDTCAEAMSIYENFNQ